MKGELQAVWSRTWKEIWSRLATNAPNDLLVELVTGLSQVPREPFVPDPPPLEAFNANGELVDPTYVGIQDRYKSSFAAYSAYRSAYEVALNSEAEARAFFRSLLSRVSTERAAVDFLEDAYGVLEEYGHEQLNVRFRNLVNDFLHRFNLRYELRGAFSLHPTMVGIFSTLVSELREVTQDDAHLRAMLADFEEAFADLKTARSQARIKTCLQNQFNMLEALGRRSPNVTANTLGAICEQLDWPHLEVKEVGKRLYKFGCDYPGVRHGGSDGNALRNLEIKDLISLSLMLISFTPYVTHGLNLDRCFTS